jgi:hypothetical protein
MGIDHTPDKAVWQRIGRGRDRVPDAARALQVRSYLVAALEHLYEFTQWEWMTIKDKPNPYPF